MAHKVGQDEALHEPDSRSDTSLSPAASHQHEYRTRGREMVSGPAVSAVDGPSSSPPGATCLEDSRYRCVEDISSGGPPGEGQKGGEKVWRKGLRQAEDSSETDMVGGSAGVLEAGQQQQGLAAAAAVMEHADPNMYSSDEWEESDLSDTDGDHSDSSDDDDPKSQVDRLIEKVTLVYLDGENSNLSSETESSDDSDFDDSDSESDITDVSPLISATASPLGLSPVLPRRALGTSPLALHDNRGLGFSNYEAQALDRQGKEGEQAFHHQLTVPLEEHHHLHHHHHHQRHQDTSDMSVLLKAVVELEEEQRRQQGGSGKKARRQESPSQPITSQPPTDNQMPQRSPPIAIHPIDASPHHRHLRRVGGGHHHRRKNMSFPNEEVRRIDRDNQILLEKIMNAHSRTSSKHHHHHHHHSHSNSSSSSTNQSFTGHHHSSRPVHRPANSTVNRRREEEKIRRENMVNPAAENSGGQAIKGGGSVPFGPTPPHTHRPLRSARLL
ncbi:lateral signaling target protein 2 homolog isoform X2 [Eriocheir sinensis]|uniref:lateral signaling target protein 2 homolog isoform X2 n=1 Tax=Eriocheir sinensis TaxID=95602 RepID=UPI0021C5CD9E|nr:lateral signaling target protein 2 homolog isoform X2 [Eriocheir sinensis]